ncbi:ankyrin repeat family protein [Actinidia rufa]|uniref:Ankyrin repeat family protein n=1 Tax=Actinidia rufa TaxID=165716 RepID=A0A7J0G2A6_9ERIC|nr:ankyrin repeat family protein [Actinidia rufa]
MASMPCTLRPIFAAKSLNSSSSSRGFAPNLAHIGSRFLGSRIKPGSRTRPGRGGLRITCWFKFGKNGVDAEGAGIYGSQSRDDFDRDDVEQVVFSLSLSDLLASFWFLCGDHMGSCCVRLRTAFEFVIDCAIPIQFKKC